MPLPKFSEEDYKNAEKEMKKKAKNEPEPYVNTTGVKPRSLHYIDDEDEEPVQSTANESRKEDEKESEGIASLVESAPVKDEEKDENN